METTRPVLVIIADRCSTLQRGDDHVRQGQRRRLFCQDTGAQGHDEGAVARRKGHGTSRPYDRNASAPLDGASSEAACAARAEATPLAQKNAVGIVRDGQTHDSARATAWGFCFALPLANALRITALP